VKRAAARGKKPGGLDSSALPALSKGSMPLRQMLARFLMRAASHLDPNARGAVLFAPGSYYSPLPDVAAMNENIDDALNSSAHGWVGVDLRPEVHGQRLERFLETAGKVMLPETPQPGFRYHSSNDFFVFADAFALAQMILHEAPRRIIEVGSGFSSAVMLDVREQLGRAMALTFIEPFPERLKSLLRAEDQVGTTLRAEPVQRVPIEVFSALEAGDFLFIDSSHVVKVGSDLADLFLRVLPALRSGVWVHFHDIFWPGPYPHRWLREGRGWNETLVLQILLGSSPHYEVEWFNAFAGAKFAGRFRERCPRFLLNTGGSLWVRKRPGEG